MRRRRLLFSAKQVEERGNHQGKDGKEEEDEANGEVDGRHEKKNQDRRQTGDDHLREKLSKKYLQPLDALAQYGQNISGSALIELSWTDGEAMLE